MEIYSDHTQETAGTIIGSITLDNVGTGLGQPMPNHVRRQMERRFCTDFGKSFHHGWKRPLVRRYPSLLIFYGTGYMKTAVTVAPAEHPHGRS